MLPISKINLLTFILPKIINCAVKATHSFTYTVYNTHPNVHQSQIIRVKYLTYLA